MSAPLDPVPGAALGVKIPPATTTDNHEFICDTCRKIDFQDLAQNPRDISRWTSVDETSPYTMQYTKDCAVCELLNQHFELTTTANTRIELRSSSFLRSSRCQWADEGDPGVQDSTLLINGVSDHGTFRSLHSDNVFCKLIGDKEQESFHAQPLQRRWNSNKAKLWLETCMQCHSSVCKQAFCDVPGMNLIDCEGMVVVKAKETTKWLALSYVWGVNHQTFGIKSDKRGFRNGSSLPLDIPRTIKDAISVTKQLGYRYLWVDEYCIDQCNESHRNAQINKMDQIYRGADLTIVAAAGEDKEHGLPGVDSTRRDYKEVVSIDNVAIFSHGPDPNKEARNSRWFTRAWTFQEGFLSRRLLVFTDQQASYYCSASSWMEGFGCLELSAAAQLDQTRTPVSLFTSLSRQRDGDYFTQLVQLYTERHLTNNADALNAFLGVVHHVRQSRPAVFTLYGLPFFELDDSIPWDSLEFCDDKLELPSDDESECSFDSKSWTLLESCDGFSEVVLNDLSWSSPKCHDTILEVFFANIVSTALSWWISGYGQHLPHERRPMFPSWTWVGWQGRVNFMHSSGYITERWSCTQKVQLETSCDEMLDLPTLWRSGDPERLQRALDTVITIHLEAPTIPAQQITIDTVGENDAAAYGQDVDSCVLTVGGRYVSCWTDFGPNILNDLVENVQQGIWSCLVLGAVNLGAYHHEKFVLVVRWKENQITAERIGAFAIRSLELEGDRCGPLEEKLEQRRIRLV